MDSLLTAGAPVTAAETLNDLKKLQLECEDKIKRNLTCIKQFRENDGRISPSLKFKYDLKVADLQKKNVALQAKLEICSAEWERLNNQTEANLKSSADGLKTESRL